MGRLASKRRIKAIDPFSKTGGVVRSFDKSAANDPLTAAGSRKKRKRKAKSRDASASGAGGGVGVGGGQDTIIGANSDNYGRSARRARELLSMTAKLEQAAEEKRRQRREKKKQMAELVKGPSKNSDKPLMERFEGESMKHFRKRINKATRARLSEFTAKKLRGNNEKRKRYLAQRMAREKAKKEVKGINKQRVDDDFMQLAASDPVAFGEQAERPPDIKHVPRKAAKRLRLRETQGAAGTASKAEEAGVAGERAAEYKRHQMELLRQQAQDAYKLMKQRQRMAKA